MKHFGNVIKAIVVGTLAIRSTMKAAVSCCVILLVVMAAMPARALEPWVLYDDFTTPLIDPDRWAGFLSANRIVEIVRVIDDLENELRLDNRGYGNTNSDSGTTFNLLGLQFTNPAAVTAIQTTVKVSAVEVTSCTANPLAANSRVRLTGRFFNTGTPIPGSDTGNVIANIFVRIRSNDPDPSTMRVLFDVFECLDASCDNSTILASGDLGTVSVNQPVMLQMQWDQPNQKFIFQRDGGPPVDAPYTRPDTAPPGIQAKGLNILTRAPNCTTAPRPVAFMSASFGAVFVNSSAANARQRR